MVAWSKLDEKAKASYFEALFSAIMEKKGDDIENQRPASIKTLAAYIGDDEKFGRVSFGAGASYKTMIEEFCEWLAEKNTEDMRKLRKALRNKGAFFVMRAIVFECNV